MSPVASSRIEKNLLGTLEVPTGAYYDIQALRAMNNFRLSGVPLSHCPKLVIALTVARWAVADANRRLGRLPEGKRVAVDKAHACLVRDDFHEQFVMDMIQGGAGTSINISTDEVIANIAPETMSHTRGGYRYLHPNDSMSMAQSTNDAYPTTVRLGLLLGRDTPLASLDSLIQAFAAKGVEFADILKMGRTQSQDAVPITFSQEFHAFATTLGEDLDRLRRPVPELFTKVSLDGTAIGIGVNTDSGYQRLAVERLAAINEQPPKPAADLIETTSDMSTFILFSGMLERTVVKLSEICNDLCLFPNGSHIDISETNLSPCQSGSSIMPGKVNPMASEAANRVVFEVTGNDLALTLAVEDGQLQLNVTESLITYKIFDSIHLLQRTMDMLREHCITGITANVERCRKLVEHSIGLATALNPYIGYESFIRIAKTVLKNGCGVLELIREEKSLDEAALTDILLPEDTIASHLIPLRA